MLTLRFKVSFLYCIQSVCFFLHPVISRERSVVLLFLVSLPTLILKSNADAWSVLFCRHFSSLFSTRSAIQRRQHSRRPARQLKYLFYKSCLPGVSVWCIRSKLLCRTIADAALQSRQLSRLFYIHGCLSIMVVRPVLLLNRL